MWNSKPTVKEVAKGQEKDLKSATRDIDKDIANLERDISKLESDIRNSGKRGDIEGAKILAKQLIKMRDQKTRLLQAKGRVSSTSYAVKSVATQATMNQAMAKSTMAMGTMNKQMNIGSMQKMANAYERESEKMAMKEELMDTVYDDVFDGNEEEENATMNQIYDEIGLEIQRSSPAISSTTKHQIKNDDDVESFIRSVATKSGQLNE